MKNRGFRDSEHLDVCSATWLPGHPKGVEYLSKPLGGLILANHVDRQRYERGAGLDTLVTVFMCRE